MQNMPSRDSCLLWAQPQVIESSAVGVPELLPEPPWLGQEAVKASRWWRGQVTGGEVTGASCVIVFCWRLVVCLARRRQEVWRRLVQFFEGDGGSRGVAASTCIDPPARAARHWEQNIMQSSHLATSSECASHYVRCAL